MKRFNCIHSNRWIAGLLIALAWSAVIAASPPSPQTATEIERALTAPDRGGPPDLRLRGGTGSTGSSVGKLRGPAAIVDDPTAESKPADSTEADPVAAPRSADSLDSLDYPDLVRNRPRIAALIHFDLNSAHIRSDAYQLLNEYSKALQSPALAQAILVIAGHTDAVGSDENNLRLSEARAQAVRDYLIEQGIAPERLLAKGYGERHPVATNNTEAGRRSNRRSEFIRID